MAENHFSGVQNGSPVRIRKKNFPSTSIYHKTTKNFGFIDKSHFCFFQLTLLYKIKANFATAVEMPVFKFGPDLVVFALCGDTNY